MDRDGAMGVPARRERLGGDPVRISPLLRLLATLSGAWLGSLAGVAWLSRPISGLCPDEPGPPSFDHDPVCSAVAAWGAPLVAAILGGTLGFVLSVRAERSRSGGGLIAVATAVGFVAAGSLGGFLGNALSSAGEPVYRHRDPHQVALRCRENSPAGPRRDLPRWCTSRQGRAPDRVLIEHRDAVNLGWTLRGGIALGAVGGGAGGLLQRRQLRGRQRPDDGIEGPDESPEAPEMARLERVVGEDPEAHPRRRLLGGGALLLSVPFAASAIAVVVSCGGALGVHDEGDGRAWEYFALYVAPFAWFLLGCFSLYQLNIFRIRSPIGKLLSAAVLVGALGAGLALAAVSIGFSRCWMF